MSKLSSLILYFFRKNIHLESISRKDYGSGSISKVFVLSAAGIWTAAVTFVSHL